MDLSQQQMFELLGIPRSRRPAFIALPTPTELETLTESTGLEAPALLGMTLSRYDGTATAIDTRTGRRALNFPFGMRAGSRFCPQCLRETQGRWQLRWRLGGAFVCTRHFCLLADVCPTCEQVPRARDPLILSVPPGHCRCGTDLSATHVHRLSQLSAIVAAQETVYKVINDDGASFGVYANTAGRASQTDPAGGSVVGPSAGEVPWFLLRLATRSRNWSCLASATSRSAIVTYSFARGM
jgi:hypothetical protein